MKTLSQIMSERPLVCDGAMGTQILQHRPSRDDFGSAQAEGCLELLCERRPEWIRSIHESYLRAGADAVETNTFGGAAHTLAEYGLAHRAREINAAAARLAREVASSFATPRFVAGSVGPGSKSLSLGHIAWSDMLASYREQMRGLLQGGVDALLIETCQDLAQIKCAVLAAREAFGHEGRSCPLWVQVTLEPTGTLLVGTELPAIIAAIAPLGVDVLGMNCGFGPAEAARHVETLWKTSPLPLSLQANAGLPENRDGQLHYPMGPDDFADLVASLAKKYGLSLVGGCCGTTPDHIEALTSRMAGATTTTRQVEPFHAVTSLYSAQALEQNPGPFLVGERTNANGSKAFREALGRNDFDALVDVAREQMAEEAHALDVCVAFAGRDEASDMDEYLRRLTTQVNAPLMIDSTDPVVVELALQRAPGRCLVNSFHFEDGETNARRLVELARKYGAAIVALTIDEQGMAREAERKVAIARRAWNLAVRECGLAPESLVIDPLTFTLASGDASLRTSAIETLQAIETIRRELPGVHLSLGISNVSFGFPARSRKVLNSLFLYEACRRGLDMAIISAAKIVPLASMDAHERQLCQRLLDDDHGPGTDPLQDFLAHFHKAPAPTDETEQSARDDRARLHDAVVKGSRPAAVPALAACLAHIDPQEILSSILLGAMKDVGEKFGRGELPLPFVLQSAEVMKQAVDTLKPHLPKSGAGMEKATVVLATVKGDVHDIGKNLVGILLGNNGYKVVDLGIRQDVQTMADALKAHGAQALGMSGLLVKSTQIMKENLQWMREHGLKIPVLLGGAALTREFVEQDCRQAYDGPVFYAEDAFEGLRILDGLSSASLAPAPSSQEARTTVEQTPEPVVIVRRRGEAPRADARVLHEGAAPGLPFLGIRQESLRVDELVPWLDTFALVRERWRFVQGSLSDEAFDKCLADVQPWVEMWLERIAAERLVSPRVAWGYWRARSEGEQILLFDDESLTPVARLSFPRQTQGRGLCLSDFIRPDDDVLALQMVTMGTMPEEFRRVSHEAGNFRDEFLFHGLAAELTEAAAECLHARIRRELGIHGKDAINRRQIFAQQYQGRRYSFGYSDCPDLAGNQTLLTLLQGEKLGVRISNAGQMYPEYTTSALVLWHPQACYFTV